ncbi:MAG: 30S ribosomal protein S3 [Clostridia bacterium]
MGQKVSPQGLRVGVIRDWNAQWYADKKNFSVNLIEDHKIREYIKTKYFQCSISKITISRILSSANDIVIINIFTAKPGVLIGKSGAGVEQIKKEVMKIAPKKSVTINILEVKRPDIDAQLVAENIASQLEKRTAFRRAMKQVISRAMKSGAKGIKTMVSGRLDGADIARSESYHEGSIPLQTIRADIDYGVATARTTFGAIGVKVWVYKGEVLGGKTVKVDAAANANANVTAVAKEGGNA